MERSPSLFYGLFRAWLLGQSPWKHKRALKALVARKGVKNGEGLSSAEKAWDKVIASSIKVAQRSALRDYLMSPAEAKGLEFKLVVLLGLSEALERLSADVAQEDPLDFYLKLNELRVAISRSTEHLVALEREGEASAEAYKLMSPSFSEGLDELGASQEQVKTKAKAKAKEELKVLSLGEQTTDERVAKLIEKADRERDRAPAAAWRALERAEGLLNTPEGDDEALRARLTPLRLKLLSPIKALSAQHSEPQLKALGVLMRAITRGSQLRGEEAKGALSALLTLTPPPQWLEPELSEVKPTLKGAFYELPYDEQAKLKAHAEVSVWLELGEDETLEVLESAELAQAKRHSAGAASAGVC
jgi:hypothetical protein